MMFTQLILSDCRGLLYRQSHFTLAGFFVSTVNPRRCHITWWRRRFEAPALKATSADHDGDQGRDVTTVNCGCYAGAYGWPAWGQRARWGALRGVGTE